MAVIQRKRKSGIVYQAKVRGSRGECISKTFKKKRDAETYEASLKVKKANRGSINSYSKKLLFKDYFEKWFLKTKGVKVSDGWRETQRQMYRDYIDPVIGDFKLESITAGDISDVLNRMQTIKRSFQTQRHAYNLLHKMFVDAVELFDISVINPAKKKLKPQIPEKESPYHAKEDCIKLLCYVKDKPFGLAIWIQLYVGLRVGEIQGLKWDSVDFINGKIHIKSTYVRKEKCFKAYPKGKKWHSVTIPPELRELLMTTSKGKTLNDYVVKSHRNPEDFMSYGGYYKALLRYCKEAGLSEHATHALRHSTSGLYDASAKDMKENIFSHSDIKVTQRYIHNKSSRFDDLIKNTMIIPVGAFTECSPNVPQTPIA